MLNPDFKEFVASCNANGVDYLIVGGYAVAFHGHPRYTKDLDIWIDATSEKAIRLIQALDDFGFGSMNLKAEDFLVPDRVVQLGDPPHRIDLLTSLLGVEFHDCYAKQMETEIDGITVRVIDRESLIRNKQATKLLQDLADVEALSPPDP